MTGSLRASTHSAGPSVTPTRYTAGPSVTPTRYNARPSVTPTRYTAGPSVTQTRYTAGPSTSTPTNTECPNCIKLNHQIMVLNKMLEVYQHPNNHTIDSVALFHDLYNDMVGDMGNLRM